MKRALALLAAAALALPAGANVLRAFSFPFDRVRVLVVGQDPYPTPGHAVGLSFSVDPQVRPLPRSLANIFTEYTADLGHPVQANAYITPPSNRGFDPHYDVHDVFILQTAGVKDYYFRANTVAADETAPPGPPPIHRFLDNLAPGLHLGPDAIEEADRLADRDGLGRLRRNR